MFESQNESGFQNINGTMSSNVTFSKPYSTFLMLNRHLLTGESLASVYLFINLIAQYNNKCLIHFETVSNTIWKLLVPTDNPCV